MAVDQIEYCGECEHYAECKARLGKGECIAAADTVKDPETDKET